MACRAIVLAVLLLAPPSLASIEEFSYEANEEGRGEHEMRGQVTCVPEALERDPTHSRCPFVRQGGVQGPVILDSVYVTWGAGGDPTGALGLSSRCSAMSVSCWGGFRVGYSMNTRRSTGGILPDIIVPGSGSFRVFHGVFEDKNSDGAGFYRVDLNPHGERVEAPENEWGPRIQASIVSFVEPGTHPPAGSRRLPSPGEPDILFTFDPSEGWYSPSWRCCSDFVLGSAGTLQVLFLDSSLVQPYTVFTVQNATLAPSTELPFTPGPDSLVDIDEYASILGPFQPIYDSTAGSILTKIPSPGASFCPYRCRAWPMAFEDHPALSPFAESFGPVGKAFDAAMGAPWSPYYQESSELGDRRGTGWELRDLYSTQYAPWIDLHLLLQPDSLVTMGYGYETWAPVSENGRLPLVRNVEGRASIPPGFTLTAEVRIGAWRDIDGDGFVGHNPTPSDPYSSGARVIADSYLTSRGEFLGGSVVTDEENSTDSIPIHLEGIDPSELDALCGGFLSCSPLRYATRPFLEEEVGGFYWISPQNFGWRVMTVPRLFWVCAGPVQVRVEGVPDVGTIESVVEDCDPVEPFLV